MSALRAYRNASLPSQLAAMRQQAKLTDWRLRLRSGKMMPVHSVILSAGSSVFDTAFNGPFSESKDKTLDVEFDDATAELGIAALYGEEVQLPKADEDVFSVLDFANYYNIEGLLAAADKCIQGTVKDETAALALLAKLPPGAAEMNIGKKCLELVGNKFAPLLLSPDTRDQMLSLPPGTLELLLQSDLIAAKEALVLRYASEWCDKNKAAGAETHSRVMSHVRLGLMGHIELNTLVRFNKHISKVAYERAVDFVAGHDDAENPLKGTVQSKKRAAFEAVQVISRSPSWSTAHKFDALLFGGKGKLAGVIAVNKTKHDLGGALHVELKVHTNFSGKSTVAAVFDFIPSNGWYHQKPNKSANVRAKVELCDFSSNQWVTMEKQKVVKKDDTQITLTDDAWPTKACVHPDGYLLLRVNVARVGVKEDSESDSDTSSDDSDSD